MAICTVKFLIAVICMFFAPVLVLIIDLRKRDSKTDSYQNISLHICLAIIFILGILVIGT